MGQYVEARNQTLDKPSRSNSLRTLAIIPITLVLALLTARKEKLAGTAGKHVQLQAGISDVYLMVYPDVRYYHGRSPFRCSIAFFNPLKELSKFFIIIAM